MKHILVFMSDQHSASCAGFAGDSLVRTPHLDRLAEQGTVFENAYTACPLCVPARAAFMAGKMPSRGNIFTNDDCLPSDWPTVAHALGAQGYDTVLIGRMHFVGGDQSHGFAARLVGDFSPNVWGREGVNRTDLGSLQGTTGENHCLRAVGPAEDQPVLEYDRAVIAAALDYLSKDHERPQFIVVGTYAPHFTYQAYPELYRYYRERVPPPPSAEQGIAHDDLVMRHKEQHPDADTMLAARAAYYAMVDNLDRQVGEVWAGWQKYLAAKGEPGVFCYLSDHGDMLGQHNIYGKKCFYEGAAKIPLLFAGEGIAPRRVETPVSICDVSQTVCELAGAEILPFADGKSLAPYFRGEEPYPNRAVESQYLINTHPEHPLISCRMVRRGPYKLIVYHGLPEQTRLYDLSADPWEHNNLAEGRPELVEEMTALLTDWKPEEEAAEFAHRRKEQAMLKAWGKHSGYVEPQRYHFQNQ